MENHPGFPCFPPPLEIPQPQRDSHIPTALMIDPLYRSGNNNPDLKPSTQRVGQNKLPKWAKSGCQTEPSVKPLVEYKGFLYQSASWGKARRVVAKVEHHQGELFPRVGFIVTNLTLPSRAVVRFYNKRGTAEQWIKEGKQAVKMTRLSCHRFRPNEVRLWLTIIAYNLGNLWRRLVLPQRIGNWSLTSLQQRLVKTGGRLVKHARYYWLLLAESHLTRRLFASMLGRINGLSLPSG